MAFSKKVLKSSKHSSTATEPLPPLVSPPPKEDGTLITVALYCEMEVPEHLAMRLQYQHSGSISIVGKINHMPGSGSAGRNLFVLSAKRISLSPLPSVPAMEYTPTGS